MSDVDDIDIEEKKLVRRRRKSRSPSKAASASLSPIGEDDKQESKVLKERVSIECPEDPDVDDKDGSITTPAAASPKKRQRARTGLQKRFNDLPLAAMHTVVLRCLDHTLVLFAFHLMRDVNRQRDLAAFNEHYAAVQIQRICRG